MHDDILLMAKRYHNFLMRRKDREVTDREEIAAMIAGMDTIRIAMNAGDGPYIVPLSFGIEEVDDGFVFYMHSAISGRKIELSAKEFSILEYMMHNQGIVLGRESLRSHIWSWDYDGESNVIDVYIRYLRKKIDDGENTKLIHTVRGAGYMLKDGTV